MNRPHQARRGGSLFIEQATKNIKHGGLCDGRDRVYAARALRRAPSEIHLRAAAPNSDRHRNALWLIRNAIIIQKILGAIDAFGNCGQRGRHHFRRVIEQVPAIGEDFTLSVFRGHPDQAALSDPAGRDLRGQVSFTLARRSNVREDHRHDVANNPATLQDLYRRDTQPLLEDFARQAHGTGVRASNIGVVRTVGDVKHRAGRLGGVDRHHHREVGKVRPSRVRIVEQRDVAGPKPERGDCGSDRHRHRSQVDRHVIAHGEDLSTAVKHRAGIVAPLLDIGRERGPAQRRAHFFRHRVKEILEDFQARGIDLHWRGSKMMFP